MNSFLSHILIIIGLIIKKNCSAYLYTLFCR
nr:MAG TPA: hypothetical protein [Caudoviricetes sp.]